ncbi:MAG: EamA family transporter [Bacteroidetes bacterium]|nr:EamA family transporter [Bacteroidota bacterium]
MLIWGFTGILGGLISLEANEITFFRTGIAFLSLVVVGFFIRGNRKLTKKELLWLIITGVIVGLHWITFFYSIKISTISIAVVCMSASTLFTSFLEPIIFKRRYYFSELILSIAVSAGVMVIFGFETRYTFGIVIGLISAFLSALYNTLNGMFVKEIASQKIAQYEMLGGLLTATAFLLVTDNLNASTFDLSGTDLFYLLVLALICTTFAFMTSVWVMKFVTPFTVSISVNMEPVYTIILALCIDWYRGTNTEQMTDGFYAGGAIIIATILVHAWLKTRLSDRQAKKNGG